MTGDDQFPERGSGNGDLPQAPAPEAVLETRREIERITRTARADTDYDLVVSFLEAMASNTPPCSANTIANYRTVLIRFLQWYGAHRHSQPLAAFAYEDVLAYQDFMREPPDDWVGPRRVKDPRDKKPFTQGLSESEVQRNAAIIARLFDYLVKQGRLYTNPWRTAAPRGHAATAPVKQERHLTRVMYDALWAHLHEAQRLAPASDRPHAIARAARQRWAVIALYIAALRPDECAHSRAGQLTHEHSGWWFSMPASITKGAKGERIALPQLFVDELAHYRSFNGITPEVPLPGDRWPLVLNLAGTRGITRRALYDVVAEIMREAADTLVTQDPAAAEILRMASPHWLRHSRATHLLEGGVNRQTVMSIMRHGNDSTLDQYIHAADADKQAGAKIALEGLVPEGTEWGNRDL
jgi:site-specific recombinase XerD